MPTVNDAAVKSFFASLYANQTPTNAVTNLDAENKVAAVVNRIVTHKDGNVASGDQAIQNLMFNYIVSTPANVAAGKPLAAVLGNIQTRAIAAFSERFPTANIDTLIDAAKAEGYDVEIMKPF